MHMAPFNKPARTARKASEQTRFQQLQLILNGLEAKGVMHQLFGTTAAWGTISEAEDVHEDTAVLDQASTQSSRTLRGTKRTYSCS